jgi:hypothetical protein
MLYGSGFLLPFYEGKFDALRVGRAVIDWSVVRWLGSTPPFVDQGWQMTNGLREGMNLKGVIEIIKIRPPTGSKYRVDWVHADHAPCPSFFSLHGSRRGG